jgi:kynurenine 3-monooxygenase
MADKNIHIVGGGLVGSLAAIYLAQKNYKVTLYERSPDMRRNDVPAGRSINLAVTTRGWKSLQEVGLKDKALELAIPMRGRMVHGIDGTTTFIPYGQRPDEVIHSVSRGALNQLLLEKAANYPAVRLLFNQRCTHFDSSSSTLTFAGEPGTQARRVHAPVVIATDGAWSTVRKSMLASVRNFNYSQEFLGHAYKELVLPAAPGGGFSLDKHALHIWPRQSYMLIALPNLDGSFTCTLFLASQGPDSFATFTTRESVVNFFERAFPDAARLMPNLADDYFGRPTGSMVTIKCSPWHVEGNVLLLGDAAHAIVPFFGQGMNCGFEDCSALGDALLRAQPGAALNWAEIFATLESQRKPNSDAIADMAVENFVEMRDTVADPKFQLKKQVGFELEQRFPDKFVPRYSMVVFRPDISYAEAQRRSILQDKLLEELCAGITSAEQVNWSLATQLINQLKAARRA